MPKVKKDAVHRHFSFNEESNSSECNYCNAKIKGHHATNLKNHMSVKHKELYKDVLSVNKNIENVSPVVQKRKDSAVDIIKLNCLKLVTVHGRPFKMLEDKAFQEIINFAIQNNEHTQSINIQSIKSMIADKAYEIKLKISAELRNKLVCLKLDSASYLDRSFIGINAQFIKNGIITIRTLAIEEVFQSQTGEFLKETLMDVLTEYRIDVAQIYCVTTDNGRNFKKMAKLMGGSYDFTEINEDEDTNSDSEDEDDNTLNMDMTFANQEIQINNFISALNEGVHTPKTMLCAAHTLQLAVKDTIASNRELQNLLQHVREVVKLLRTPTVRNILRQANLRKPILDCPTRWASTYNMLVRLQSLKSICLHDTDMMTRLTESSWQTINDLVDCLKPVYVTTLKLQREQLTLGDFFIDWITCKGHLENSRTEISQSLLESLKIREVHLLNTNVMLEALYMDVRLNVVLSDAEAAKARLLLLETFKQIEKIKQLNEPISETGSLATSTINDQAIASCSSGQNTSLSTSYAEQILHATELQRGIERQQSSNSIDSMLREVRKIPRLPTSENILQYWNSKLSSPDLSQLALSVLAAPATQVSVERLFSSVKFILSPLRSNLRRGTLGDIMVIRSNQDLFD